MKYTTDYPKHLDKKTQFVCLTYDDNMYSGLKSSGSDGGIDYFLSLFASHKNFDKSHINASFFIKTLSFEGKGPDSPELMREVLQKALSLGHELASHTHTHPHGIEVDWNSGVRKALLTKEDWKKEISISLDHLYSLGLAKVEGFRTPYLEYNSEVFKAVAELGLVYDSSIDEGWQPELSEKVGVWPYGLGLGSPGEAWLSRQVFKAEPLIGSIPNLVEAPTAVLTLPDDQTCGTYGILPGLRARVATLSNASATPRERILSFDWNWYWQYSMTEDEIVGTLKFNLDERLKGNRAPLIISGHTDYYSPRYDEAHVSKEDQKKCKLDIFARRRVWERFVEYAVSKPEVHLTNLSRLLNIMRG